MCIRTAPPAFAVALIRQWWTMTGRQAYHEATALLAHAFHGDWNYELRPRPS